MLAATCWCAIASASSFETQFESDESPVFEGGKWLNLGLDWTYVVSRGGAAFGTHRPGDYDDSYAHLTGFSPNQYAEATIVKTGSFETYQELEIYLRFDDSAHFARGYEVQIEANNAYAYVVRWNGPLGDFTHLSSPDTFALPRPPETGDVFAAQIVGDVITVYFNGMKVGRVMDSTWADGNPGIGFFSGDSTGAQNLRFGITRFVARDVEN